MDTKQVGQRLVDFCRKGKNMDAINTLYSKDVVSVEPQGSEAMPAEMRGIDKIRGKNEWWANANEIHSASVEGPFPHQDRFTAIFNYEFTPKEGPHKGKRVKMREVALYTVKDGKVVREEFFYEM